MKRLHKFILFIIVVTAQSAMQSCQTESQQQTASQLFAEPVKQPSAELIKQQQFYSLLKQGMQQQTLDKNQKSLKCESLKQDYQQESSWQTAWLLVFFSDDEFSCINLHEKKKILHSLTDLKVLTEPLHWLNSNQSYLLSSISQLKKKNKNLKKQLNHANELVTEMNLKIEALKAIEDGINKKLNEPQQNAR